MLKKWLYSVFLVLLFFGVGQSFAFEKEARGTELVDSWKKLDELGPDIPSAISFDLRIETKKLDELGSLISTVKQKFALTGIPSSWFDDLSEALLQKLKGIPSNQIDDFAGDLNAIENAIKQKPELVDSWKLLFEANSTLSGNIAAIQKIDFLKTKGLTDLQLKNIGGLNDIKAVEIAENFNLRSTALNDNLDELITNTFNANSRAELATWSIQYGFNTDLVSQLEKLSLSSKLDQPESMLTFFNSQLTKRFENPGYVAQLNEAIKHLDAGSTIRIEGGADIIDLTNSKAYQYKAFTSPTLDKFKSNLQSAAKQFTTEQAPSGYDKIAKLKVLDSSNPTYPMTSDELQSVLQNYMDSNALNATGDNLKALTEIQVENGNGLFRYTIENTLVLKIE